MNTKKKSDVIKAEQTASKKTAPVKGQEVKSGKAMVWLAALIALVGIVAYYYFEGVNTLYSFGALIVGIAIGVGVFFVSPSGKNLVTFFKEARVELRRVVWPSMDETRKMTILVVIVMVITLLLLMFVDFIIKNIISFILSFS